MIKCFHSVLCYIFYTFFPSSHDVTLSQVSLRRRPLYRLGSVISFTSFDIIICTLITRLNLLNCVFAIYGNSLNLQKVIFFYNILCEWLLHHIGPLPYFIVSKVGFTHCRFNVPFGPDLEFFENGINRGRQHPDSCRILGQAEVCPHKALVRRLLYWKSSPA